MEDGMAEMTILNKLEAFKVQIEEEIESMQSTINELEGMIEDTEEQIDELKEGKMFNFARWQHVANIASAYPLKIPNMPDNEDELLFETLSSNIK